MFSNYLPGLRKTLDLFHEAEKSPFANKQNWLALQEQMIKQITAAENRIRNARAGIKRAKKELGTPGNQLDKAAATDRKNHIEYLKYRIEANELLLFVYRSIGDGMAYTFINRHDIKPMVEKQHAGFISQKKGNRLERKILRYAFKAGGIAILNDLTNYLRYFDITIIKGKDAWLPIEVKSSKASAGSPRAKRQAESGSTLLKYLLDDQPMAVPGLDKQRIRFSQTSRTKDHVQKLNDYIAIAKEKGYCIGKPEKGLVYWVAYRFEPPNDILDHIKSTPTYFSLNEYKFAETVCVPFVKLIKSTDDYLNFLQGDLVIIMLLEMDLLKSYAFDRGYDMLPANSPGYAYNFRPHDKVKPAFNISEAMVARIFLECYSPKWFMKENMDFINQTQLPDQLNNLPDSVI